MYNIEKEIKNKIYTSINNIIDEYLQGRTSGTKHAFNVYSREDYDKYFDGKIKTVYDAKKDFNKDSAITQLIKDIKYTGLELLRKIDKGDEKDINIKYRNTVKKILNDILNDRLALQKDKIKENYMTVKKFNNFVAINEIKLPVVRIEELLHDVSQITNDTQKSVLTTFFKTYIEYIDVADKKKHQFKIHDISGDIMENNRVTFDAVIYDKNDLEQIKKNIVDYSIGEFYTLLPSNVNVFGIDLKPSSFLDKAELKYIFEEAIPGEEVINIITQVLGLNHEGKFNDFFIWSNKK